MQRSDQLNKMLKKLYNVHIKQVQEQIMEWQQTEIGRSLKGLKITKE